MKLITATLLACFALASQADNTSGTEDTIDKHKLVIVSSFPSEMTSLFESAYEAKHPSVDIEIIKKKTTAGIAYVEDNPD